MTQNGPHIIPADANEINTTGPRNYAQLALQHIVTQEYKARNLAMSVIHPETGSSMEYEQLLKDPMFKDDWLHSSANEFGRLA